MTGYDIKPSRWLSFDTSELWRFRELFWFMAWRDIKVKYKQTLLGFLWVILQPLVLMIIFSILWTRVIKIESVSMPYPLFAFSGLILWGLFSSGVSAVSESMISNSNIIKKVYFPRIIIPVSAMAVSLFDFVMTLGVYFLMTFYFRVHFSFESIILLMPMAILITIISSVGFGLIIASATVKYRDFRYVLPFLLQALFFVSPVVFPLTLFGNGSLRLMLSLNPLAGSINLARSAITGTPVNWNLIFFSSLIALLLFVAGLTLFRRMESQYSDML